MGTDCIYDKEWEPGSVEKEVWDLLVPSSTEDQLETLMGIVADFKSELFRLKQDIKERERKAVAWTYAFVKDNCCATERKLLYSLADVLQFWEGEALEAKEVE